MLVYFFVLATVALPTTDRFIGIVELPALGAVDNADHEPETVRTNKSVVLHKDPNIAASAVATVTDSNQLVAEEFAYEAEAPAVYGQIHGWYLLLTRTGARGWLAPKDAGKFHPYRDLAGAWAGVPTAASVLLAPSETSGPAEIDVADLDEGDLDVRIIESKQVKDTLWFKVEVLQDVCEGDEKRVKGVGWVQAHTQKGEHTLLFRTRGC